MTPSFQLLPRSGSIAAHGGVVIPLIATLAVVVITAVLLVLSLTVTPSDSPSQAHAGGDGSPADAADPTLGHVPGQAASDPRALPPEANPALRAFVDSQASERLPDDFDYQVGHISDEAELTASSSGGAA